MTRKKDPRTGLTEQQEKFCQEYIKNPIMYQALIKAYPKAKNWKRTSADAQASRMLDNPLIDARIKHLMAEKDAVLAKSVTLSQRKILEEIISQYQQTSANGASERTNSVALLKLMSQISKLIGENGTNVTVNVQNNTVVGEVTDYLDL